MPNKCVVAGCTSSTQTAGLHRFPRDQLALQKWKEVLLMPADWMPIETERVCSLHFDPAAVTRRGSKVRLLECAIPRIAAYKEHHKTEATAPPDHDYALPNPVTLKRRLDFLTEKVESDEKKRRNSLKRETRLRRNLSTILTDLKKGRMLNEEMQVKLQAFSDIPTDLFNRPTHEYTEEQKDFALTLHMYSGKAYDFVRRSGVQLPNQRTLARWLSSVDDKPGFSLPMLSCLEERCQNDPKQYENCTLCLDGMSIKQNITFDQSTGTMTGFEDLGDGEEGEDEAKEAIVFMLVGVTGHWKAPIGYFFTKRLSAEGQKQLLFHALSLLAERNIGIRTVVMDGHGTNVGMFGLLGGSFQETNSTGMKTSFCDPATGREVYVMFDACHMLKLIRNMLHSYGNIQSADGQVSWNYIAMLHKHQQADELRLANRLSESHVSFADCKMRVSTAAQTLSRSASLFMR